MLTLNNTIYVLISFQPEHTHPTCSDSVLSPTPDCRHGAVAIDRCVSKALFDFAVTTFFTLEGKIMAGNESYSRFQRKKIEMDDDKLIDMVRENRALYDPDHCKYADAHYREKAWKVISAELEQPGE